MCPLKLRFRPLGGVILLLLALLVFLTRDRLYPVRRGAPVTRKYPGLLPRTYSFTAGSDVLVLFANGVNEWPVERNSAEPLPTDRLATMRCPEKTSSKFRNCIVLNQRYRWTEPRRERAFYWEKANLLVFNAPSMWIPPFPPNHNHSDWKNTLPPRKYPHQAYLMHSLESLDMYPNMRAPLMRRHFEFTGGYSKQFDDWSTYPELGSVTWYRNITDQPKTGFVAFIQGNCVLTINNRTGYVQELMKYIRVDSYGSCLKNADLPQVPSNQHDPTWGSYYADKLSILSRYKFTLAMENTNTEDWVTEKVYHPLRVGSVPVYMGAPNIDEWIPSPDSIVKVSDFMSPLELAAFLLQAAADEDLYSTFFKWRKKPLPKHFVEVSKHMIFSYERNMESGKWYPTEEPWVCRLCDLYAQHANTTELS